MTAERTKIYKCRLPEGLRVPLLVKQSNIKDAMTTEAELSEAVRGTKGGREEGPSGMCTEDLKGWLHEVTCKKDPLRRR